MTLRTLVDAPPTVFELPRHRRSRRRYRSDSDGPAAPRPDVGVLRPSSRRGAVDQHALVPVPEMTCGRCQARRRRLPPTHRRARRRRRWGSPPCRRRSVRRGRCHRDLRPAPDDIHAASFVARDHVRFQAATGPTSADPPSMIVTPSNAFGPPDVPRRPCRSGSVHDRSRRRPPSITTPDRRCRMNVPAGCSRRERERADAGQRRAACDVHAVLAVGIPKPSRRARSC